MWYVSCGSQPKIAGLMPYCSIVIDIGSKKKHLLFPDAASPIHKLSCCGCQSCPHRRPTENWPHDPFLSACSHAVRCLVRGILTAMRCDAMRCHAMPCNVIRCDAQGPEVIKPARLRWLSSRSKAVYCHHRGIYHYYLLRISFSFIPSSFLSISISLPRPLTASTYSPIGVTGLDCWSHPTSPP